MTIKIGVIGTGMMGSEHVRRLTEEVSGAQVVAVYDLATERAREIAAGIGGVAHDSWPALVEDPAVDAVLIASPGDLHAEQVLACLSAGKPVLCEKPLANTTLECLKVVEAEAAMGRRLVQIGFMRRYDEGYAAARRAVADGAIGEPLVGHFVHRNPAVPDTWHSGLTMTDALVHEIDAARFLLGQEIVATTVISCKPSPQAPTGVKDPQLVLLEMASGAVVECEVFVACSYGYEVRGEVVGSSGTVLFDRPVSAAQVRSGVEVRTAPANFKERFGAAFVTELQSWVNGVAATAGSDGDRVFGPSAWDGYASTVVAETCLASLDSGTRAEVPLAQRPALYA